MLTFMKIGPTHDEKSTESLSDSQLPLDLQSFFVGIISLSE